MVEYLADILGEQVARQAFLYALSGSGERFGGMKQGFVMAGVENYGCSRVVQIVRAYALAQRTEQSVQMSFELGRQPFDGNGYPFSESCLLGCEFLRIQPVAFVQDDDEPLFGPGAESRRRGRLFLPRRRGHRLPAVRRQPCLSDRTFARYPCFRAGRRFRGYLPYR